MFATFSSIFPVVLQPFQICYEQILVENTFNFKLMSKTQTDNYSKLDQPETLVQI